MRAGRQDEAVSALSAAMEHAIKFDKTDESGMERYTCPVLSGYTEDHRGNRKEDWTMTEDVRRFAEEERFAPLRERGDFQALFGEC